MEIRQITASERPEAFFPLATYAFMPSPWQDGDFEKYARRAPYFETTTHLVAEEDGRARAAVSALAMRQNVRGSVQDMAGVASVVSHPDVRRRGVVRRLLTELLALVREQGSTVSALYPFRPSFYEKFGFVGVPSVRTASFAPEGLASLVRAELPGSVEQLHLRDGFDAYDAFTRRLLGERHGFAVFDETRTEEFRGLNKWVALARSAGGEVVGAVTYRIEGFGRELIADDLLCTGPLGRALLLRFFARHVDQVARVRVTVSADQLPELWGTDLAVHTQADVHGPGSNGPMVRLLSIEALNGLRTPAESSVTVEVTGDDLLAGRYRISGAGGTMSVEPSTREPAATLSCAGLSALAYGVLDPAEVVLRGFGAIGGEGVTALGELFPKELPYLFADF